jgi:DNA-binding response OmpR family regulator
MAKILVVEDMKGIADSLALILSMSKHTVDVAADGETAMRKLRDGTPYDLAICDIVLPDIDGTSVIIEARRLRPRMPIIAMSGGATGVTAAQALLLASQKADRAMPKPFSRDELLKAVDDLLART